MHDTAYDIGRMVLERYAEPGSVIVELGAWDFNGSLRGLRPEGSTYIGVDVAEGPGVDLVCRPGDRLPVEDGSAGLVIASSTLEHDPFFWNTFVELARIVKPEGVLYINSPSNGKFHRYPKDYWRFYPDCGHALEQWARKNGQDVRLIESFTALRKQDTWNDFVAIFKKSNDVGPDGLTFLSDEIGTSSSWKTGRDNTFADYESLACPQPNELLVEDMRIIRDLRAEVARLNAALAARAEAVPFEETTAPVFPPAPPVAAGDLIEELRRCLTDAMGDDAAIEAAIAGFRARLERVLEARTEDRDFEVHRSS